MRRPAVRPVAFAPEAGRVVGARQTVVAQPRAPQRVAQAVEWLACRIDSIGGGEEAEEHPERLWNAVRVPTPRELAPVPGVAPQQVVHALSRPYIAVAPI